MAEAIHKIIDEKKEWAIKTNEAIMELRKTRYLIKYDCDNHKSISFYEQGKQRFLARYFLVKSTAGINEIFNEDTHNSIRELVKFDESIMDVCAHNAPDDELWRAYLLKVNQQMHQSISEERARIEELNHGFFQNL